MPEKRSHAGGGGAALGGGLVGLSVNPDAAPATPVEEVGTRLTITVETDGEITVLGRMIVRYEGRTLVHADAAPINISAELREGLLAAQKLTADTLRGAAFDAAYEARSVARRMGELS